MPYPSAGYGQPPSGQYVPPGGPGIWPQPQAPAPSRNSSPLIIGITLAIVVVIVAAVLGIVITRGNSSTTQISGAPTATLAPNATAVPTATTAPAATVLFKDPLTSNVNGWSSDKYCYFANNSYNVAGGAICYAPTNQVGDAVVSVDAKLLSGSDLQPYGLVVRRVSKGNFYIFEIDSTGQWDFGVSVSNQFNELVNPTFNSALKTGLGAKNTLKVVMKGSDFTFFANGVQVGTFSDTTFTAGDTGVAGGLSGTIDVFNNFEIDQAN